VHAQGAGQQEQHHVRIDLGLPLGGRGHAGRQHGPDVLTGQAVGMPVLQQQAHRRAEDQPDLGRVLSGQLAGRPGQRLAVALAGRGDRGVGGRGDRPCRGRQVTPHVLHDRRH
jgi:hypothetical protein